MHQRCVWKVMNMAAINEWFGLYNVILNWVKSQDGEEAMKAYSRYIGEHCYKSQIESIREEGLSAIESQLVHPMRMDGGEIGVTIQDGTCCVDVHQCPSLMFNSQSDNPHFKNLRDACTFDFCVNEAIARECGLAFSGHMTESGCHWQFDTAQEEAERV